MESIDLNIKGEGLGAWPGLASTQADKLTHLSTLDGATESGKPVVILRGTGEDGKPVMLYTTGALFLAAAAAVRGRYGNL